MISIIRATEKDGRLLAEVGRISFIESHSTSAAKADIDLYVDKTYSIERVKTDLKNQNNHYHFIFENKEIVGYSKMIFNATDSNIEMKNVTKLERIYLLQKYYGLKFGFEKEVSMTCCLCSGSANSAHSLCFCRAHRRGDGSHITRSRWFSHATSNNGRFLAQR